MFVSVTSPVLLYMYKFFFRIVSRLMFVSVTSPVLLYMYKFVFCILFLV